MRHVLRPESSTEQAQGSNNGKKVKDAQDENVLKKKDVDLDLLVEGGHQGGARNWNRRSHIKGPTHVTLTNHIIHTGDKATSLSIRHLQRPFESA